VTGRRRFFVNQAGDILESGNEVAQVEGTAVVPNGNSAFLGDGITSPAAVGTRGRDGDLWRVADAAGIAGREAAAVRALETLLAAQAAVRASGDIDVDGDSEGEYATLKEITQGSDGRAAVLPGPVPGTDFSVGTGELLERRLPRTFEPLENGDFVLDGYVFRLFLPSAQAPAGFTHEVRYAGGPSLADPGVAAPIGIDASESYWCAYAHPVEFGVTGRRRFFVNQLGVVLESANETTRVEGVPAPVAGNEAFLGDNISSPIAVGTLGRDGELWKPVD
jgi:hypothetical protein